MKLIIPRAFAAKWNFITLVTGVSHERLQVYHRWLAYACFVLALVHTFPFVVFRRWKGQVLISLFLTGLQLT